MSDKLKTFIILTPGFAKDEADTTCLPVLQDMIRSFNEQFPLLKIIVLSFDYPYFIKSYTWFGNEVISFDGRNRGGLYKILLWRRIGKKLEVIRQSHEIVGILSMWLGTCARVGKKFADKHGLKHLTWLFGQDVKAGNKYVSRVDPGPDELIALSDFIQNEYFKNYGVKPIAIVPPGVDWKNFLMNNVEKDIDVVAAGSLIPLKQYDVFIHVIAELKKKKPGVKAVLIGDGPGKKNLQDLIVALKLESNITLTGELSHPDVLKQMQRAKIFLHTSSYEGFGVVCIEALASGAKVVSFIKPMNDDVEDWYIVTTKEEMIQKAFAILDEKNLRYKGIIPFTIEDTVIKMARSFSIQ